MKTNKAFMKRIRVTKRGTLLARAPGQNHFNAKESRRSQLRKKRTSLFVMTSKSARRFLTR